jgi:hypothetical protein
MRDVKEKESLKIFHTIAVSHHAFPLWGQTNQIRQGRRMICADALRITS